MVVICKVESAGRGIAGLIGHLFDRVSGPSSGETHPSYSHGIGGNNGGNNGGNDVVNGVVNNVVSDLSVRQLLILDMIRLDHTVSAYSRHFLDRQPYGLRSGTGLRPFPSHAKAWAPPVHEATGGYAVRRPQGLPPLSVMHAVLRHARSSPSCPAPTGHPDPWSGQVVTPCFRVQYSRLAEIFA